MTTREQASLTDRMWAALNYYADPSMDNLGRLRSFKGQTTSTIQALQRRGLVEATDDWPFLVASMAGRAVLKEQA